MAIFDFDTVFFFICDQTNKQMILLKAQVLSIH